jgi:hypothetical protein
LRATIQETTDEVIARSLAAMRRAQRPLRIEGAVTGLLYTLHWQSPDARPHLIIRTFDWERYKAAVQQAHAALALPQLPPAPRTPVARRRRLRRRVGESWVDRRAEYLAATGRA